MSVRMLPQREILFQFAPTAILKNLSLMYPLLVCGLRYENLSSWSITHDEHQNLVFAVTEKKINYVITAEM